MAGFARYCVAQSEGPQGTAELEKLSLAYTSYVRALLGAILEYIGLPTTTVRKSLNGVTSYKLPVSESVLPNKSNWNINEPGLSLERPGEPGISAE